MNWWRGQRVASQSFGFFFRSFFRRGKVTPSVNPAHLLQKCAPAITTLSVYKIAYDTLAPLMCSPEIDSGLNSDFELS